jgi:hypothetical protein
MARWICFTGFLFDTSKIQTSQKPSLLFSRNYASSGRNFLTKVARGRVCQDDDPEADTMSFLQYEDPVFSLSRNGIKLSQNHNQSGENKKAKNPKRTLTRDRPFFKNRSPSSSDSKGSYESPRSRQVI